MKKKINEHIFEKVDISEDHSKYKHTQRRSEVIEMLTDTILLINMSTQSYTR